jgi:hypothetical protein
MTLIPLSECCVQLGVDPKTVIVPLWMTEENESVES